jgi:hypothetical protein
VAYNPAQKMGAQVSLYNHTLGKSFAHIIAIPEGSNYSGISCEWILEATTPPVPDLQDDSTFPAFTETNFACTAACASDPAALNPSPVYQSLGDIQCHTRNSCLDNGQLTQTTISSSLTPVISIQRLPN